MKNIFLFLFVLISFFSNILVSFAVDYRSTTVLITDKEAEDRKLGKVILDLAHAYLCEGKELERNFVKIPLENFFLLLERVEKGEDKLSAYKAYLYYGSILLKGDFDKNLAEAISAYKNAKKTFFFGNKEKEIDAFYDDFRLCSSDEKEDSGYEVIKLVLVNDNSQFVEQKILEERKKNSYWNFKNRIDFSVLGRTSFLSYSAIHGVGEVLFKPTKFVYLGGYLGAGIGEKYYIEDPYKEDSSMLKEKIFSILYGGRGGLTYWGLRIGGGYFFDDLGGNPFKAWEVDIGYTFQEKFFLGCEVGMGKEKIIRAWENGMGFPLEEVIYKKGKFLNISLGYRFF